MSLCCEVNPTKECKTCRKRFCSEHVYHEVNRYSGVASAPQCFKCYRTETILPPRKGMTMKELFLELRNVCPRGYMTITTSVSDGNPGISKYTTEWQVYHESYKHVKAATPEQVLASFRALVNKEHDPQVSPLDNINV